MRLSRIAAAGSLLVGAFLALLWAAAPASAHATVVSSSPADGARLQRAPATVSVTFDEAVGLSGVGYLQVVNGSGQRVDTGPLGQPKPQMISVALRPGLGQGAYVASYRVISADSHPVGGSIRFAVGNAALPNAPNAGSTNNHSTDAIFDVVRAIGYAGLVGIGGSWLLLTVWPEGKQHRRARRIVWIGWGAAVVGTLGEFLVQGPYAAGSSITAVTHVDLLRDTVHSSYGTAHEFRLLLLAVLAIFLDRIFALGRRVAWLVDGAALAWLGVAVTYPLTGHARTAWPRWLATGADTLHLLAMSAWLGGLVVLFASTLPDAPPPIMRRVVPIFSRVALCCVTVLIGTGIYQAWRETRGWQALFDTTYGRLVIAKAALVVFVVLVASRSRRLVRAGTVDARPLRRAVLVESVFAAGALAVAAVLVAQPPAQQVATARTAAKLTTAHTAVGHEATATVTVDPRRHGAVQVSVEISGAQPQQLAVTATQSAKRIGPLPVAVRGRSGHYTAAGVSLPVAGTWTFHLTVTWSQFDAVSATVTLRLS